MKNTPFFAEPPLLVWPSGLPLMQAQAARFSPNIRGIIS